MGIPEIKADHYTYADYLTWKDDCRWEIIYGNAYAMAPAPGTSHQRILGQLFTYISLYLKGKKCEAFMAPFDVRLATQESSDDEIETVVQPDISIFCDPSKIDARGAQSAPDLVVEILSASTTKMDFGIKLLLYQKYGVKEYWIVDPEAKSINVYKLDLSGKYFLDCICQSEDLLRCGLFPELQINLKEIFV